MKNQTAIPNNAVRKHENEWMWQFWLIFGEFLEINEFELWLN